MVYLMRPFVCALVLLALLIPPAAGEAVTAGGRYVAATPLFAIWCDAAPHALAPIGDPDEYSSPLGWLFSGRPECAFGDAFNAAAQAQGEAPSETGVGGFAWALPANVIGSQVRVWTEDLVFDDAPFIHVVLTADGDGAEGCGPQSFVAPQEMETHWHSTPTNPLYLMWAYLPIVGVDDELELCFGTTGMVWAQWDQ